jgi:alkylhydroperoxidase family enzyme
MSEEMVLEVMAVLGMANKTNRLASGCQVEIGPKFKE